MSEPAENIGAEAPAKPKRAKPKPRRKRASANVVPFKAPDEFAGMTARECCADCCVDRCVISQINVCAHPFKSPMQSEMMRNPERLARYQRARKALAHQKVDLRDS